MASNAQCQCKKCMGFNDCYNKFCIHCGSKLEQTSSSKSKSHTSQKECAKCGYINASDSKFCIQCGSNQFIEETTHSEDETIAGYIIILLAYIAKGDGVISSQEASLISKILDEVSLDDAMHREKLKDVFNRGKNKHERNHQEVSKKLYSDICSEISDSTERKKLLNIVGMYFMALVYVDGSLNAKQNSIVVNILKTMQFTDRMINELHEQFKEEEEEQQSSYAHQSSSDSSYKMLGCQPSDSDDTIKKAYRELAKQYHPDKLSGKDIPEAIMILATEKLKEINAAYEKIKKLRGMK